VPWSYATARIGCTPLVRVRVRVRGRWRSLWLKLEQFNRGGSIKDRTAYGLLADLEERGLMRHADTVVESTSGNLGIGLALACAQRGYQFVAVVDPMASEYSVARMKDFGARIEVVEPEPDTPYLAARLARVRELQRGDPRMVWTNQYGNPANPRIHRNHTGAEVLRQLGRPPGAVFVAVSTGGTLKGVSQYFRTSAPSARVAAVDIDGSVVLGGPRGKRHIPGIGSSQPSQFLDGRPYDDAWYVSEVEAVATCHVLRRCTNIGIGGSSGAVVAAAARFLSAVRHDGPVVCLCPDGSDRYEHTIYSPQWVAANGLWPDGGTTPLPFDDIDCN
jgi:cysteine synthase A